MSPIPGMQWDEIGVGSHHCEIADAELGVSSTGNPTLIVRLLVDKEIADMAVFSLLPQAMFKLRSFLRVLGFDKSNDPDPDDLVGMKFEGLYAEDDRGQVRLSDWRVDASPDDADEDEEEEEERPAPRKAAVAKKKVSSGKARDFE